MATVGRKKRRRKAGSRTGVTVKPHARSPRGPDSKNGKRKRQVRVDPYSRGKPKSSRSTNSGRKRRGKRKKKRS